MTAFALRPFDKDYENQTPPRLPLNLMDKLDN